MTLQETNSLQHPALRPKLPGQTLTAYWYAKLPQHAGTGERLLHANFHNPLMYTAARLPLPAKCAQCGHIRAPTNQPPSASQLPVQHRAGHCKGPIVCKSHVPYCASSRAKHRQPTSTGWCKETPRTCMCWCRGATAASKLPQPADVHSCTMCRSQHNVHSCGHSREPTNQPTECLSAACRQ